MKSILQVLGSVVLLSAPLCVSADWPSDISIPLPLSMNEEHLSSVRVGAGVDDQSVSGALSDATDTDLFLAGDFDANDAILLSSLLEESRQGRGPSGDRESILAEADGMQGDNGAKKNEGAAGGESDDEDTENNQIADPLYYWNVLSYVPFQ